ncbi:MAG: 3-oxoacyl-[Clostridia bacterium]|nr:3-oxoacyl-[acyl-carrier-protein] reductase [Clostridia bacterium]
MNDFQGKRVVITGGSRGIGKHIAESFASQGASVAVISSGKYNCENVTNTFFYQCDVSNFRETQKVISDILEQMGDIDILVNNAGITRDKLVNAMSEEDFDRVIEVNLKGTFNMIKHCYRYFAKRRCGRIINIASVSGILGPKGQANYAASKAGIIGLTKSVARELGSRGITCNCVAPGFIETDMTSKLPENVKEEYLKQIPAGRYGTTDDVCNAVLFLASDASSYITGQVIHVDGGMLM